MENSLLTILNFRKITEIISLESESVFLKSRYLTFILELLRKSQRVGKFMVSDFYEIPSFIKNFIYTENLEVNLDIF